MVSYVYFNANSLVRTGLMFQKDKFGTIIQMTVEIWQKLITLAPHGALTKYLKILLLVKKILIQFDTLPSCAINIYISEHCDY